MHGTVVVQSNNDLLFTVNPQTGGTTMLDLNGETVTNGDGILLNRGRRLWVLQNCDNLRTLVRLEPDLGSGDVTGRFTDETFDVPTTLAGAGDRLALVNARFGTDSPETAEYWVTQIRRPRRTSSDSSSRERTSAQSSTRADDDELVHSGLGSPHLPGATEELAHVGG